MPQKLVPPCPVLSDRSEFAIGRPVKPLSGSGPNDHLGFEGHSPIPGVRLARRLPGPPSRSRLGCPPPGGSVVLLTGLLQMYQVTNTSRPDLGSCVVSCGVSCNADVDTGRILSFSGVPARPAPTLQT